MSKLNYKISEFQMAKFLNLNVKNIKHFKKLKLNFNFKMLN